MLSQLVFLRKPLLTALFNSGQLAISLGVANITTGFVRSLTPDVITCEIIAMVVGMAVFDLCNITLVSQAVCKERQEAGGHVLNRCSSPTDVASSPLCTSSP